MEADQVGAEEPAQHLVAPREHAKHVRRRERDVQEEPDGRVGQALAQQLRHKRKLVVVHPDVVARAILLGDDVGEPLGR